VLVNLYNRVASHDAAYGSPSFTKTGRELVVKAKVRNLPKHAVVNLTDTLQNIHCLLNVAHNCVKEGCTIDPAGAQRNQDADKEDQIAIPAIAHEAGVKRVVLNTNLIRSAHLLRSLYGRVVLAPSAASIARKALQGMVAAAAAKADEARQQDEQAKGKEKAPSRAQNTVKSQAKSSKKSQARHHRPGERSRSRPAKRTRFEAEEMAASPSGSEGEDSGAGQPDPDDEDDSADDLYA
jgi:hypothetical protein